MFNFAKNRKVKDLSGVPANLQVMYEPAEDGEGFVLRSDEVTTAAVAVITGMDNALRAVRKEADDAKKGLDLTTLADYGNTPEEIKATMDQKIAELSEASKGAAETKSQIEKIKREAAEAHSRAIAEKDQQLSSMESQINDYIVDTQISTAASRYPGLNVKLVMPHARPHLGIQVEDVEGKKVRRVVVKDANGELRYSRKAERAGERMDVSELLDEMANDKEYAVLFPSTAKTGGDSRPATGPVHKGIQKATDDMSSKDMIKAGLAARRK